MTMRKSKERETRNFGYDIEKELGRPEPKGMGDIKSIKIYNEFIKIGVAEQIEILEELLEDANREITDGFGHTTENCDSVEECPTCDLQRRIEKYFKEKNGG